MWRLEALELVWFVRYNLWICTDGASFIRNITYVFQIRSLNLHRKYVVQVKDIELIYKGGSGHYNLYFGAWQTVLLFSTIDFLTITKCTYALTMLFYRNTFILHFYVEVTAKYRFPERFCQKSFLMMVASNLSSPFGVSVFLFHRKLTILSK